MASTSTLRLRRSAAQWHALENVERQIRATDPHMRRKYLREYHDAFRTYETVLLPAQLQRMLCESDIILVGDYHALASHQLYTAQLVEQLAPKRPVALAVETIFSRDQHIVEEWLAGDIENDELRERIRFDDDWGYDWEPFRELLDRARGCGAHVYGLDCMPRGDLRRIAARDRHAAAKLAEIREARPDAVVVALFGESHLAPNHLPLLLRRRRPQDRVLTVLQNVDALYWRAAGEPHDHVSAVRVANDVVCAFNATPLEKYEAYRRYIERWRQPRPTRSDVAPTFYNLVEALFRFLNIDRYLSATTGPAPRYLLDLLPEVYSRDDNQQFRKILTRKGIDESEQARLVEDVRRHGVVYVPRANVVLAREFAMSQGAAEAARFVHHACRGVAGRAASPTASAENDFYRAVISEALAEFGARTISPGRPPRRESDLYSLYSLDREAVDAQGICSYREFMQMIDFLVLHKDYEASALHYREIPALIVEGVQWNGSRREYMTRSLGGMLGSELYHAYVHGRVTKRMIRSLFLRDLDRDARTVYFVLVRKLRRPRRLLVS